jgi:hypothetical protein
MAQDIIIFEGPAGAGKSTVIKALLGDGWISDVPTALGSIPRPRAYETFDSGATLSLVKDVCRLSELIGHADGKYPRLYMDRGFVSQSVYHYLRSGSAAGFRHSIDLLPSSLYSIQRTLSSEYNRRRFWQNQLEEDLQISIVFVIPETREVKRRRVLAEKNYPYAAEEEVAFYRMACNQLIARWELRSGPYFLPVIHISGLDDLHSLKLQHDALHRLSPQE